MLLFDGGLPAGEGAEKNPVAPCGDPIVAAVFWEPGADNRFNGIASPDRAGYKIPPNPMIYSVNRLPRLKVLGLGLAIAAVSTSSGLAGFTTF